MDRNNHLPHVSFFYSFSFLGKFQIAHLFSCLFQGPHHHYLRTLVKALRADRDIAALKKVAALYATNAHPPPHQAELVDTCYEFIHVSNWQLPPFFFWVQHLTFSFSEIQEIQTTPQHLDTKARKSFNQWEAQLHSPAEAALYLLTCASDPIHSPCLNRTSATDFRWVDLFPHHFFIFITGVTFHCFFSFKSDVWSKCNNAHNVWNISETI